MSGALDMLVPALALSGLMLACLVLLPQAPPRVRFWIAVAGLAAWVLPWPWIAMPWPLPGAVAAGGAIPGAPERIALLAAWPPGSEPFARGGLGYAGLLVAALFLPGALWFVRDAAALHRAARGWRTASRSGEALRGLLPVELRDTRAEIRIVEGTRLAAASGWIRPTVWVGSRLSAAELRLALVHELWHVRRRDPLRIALILAVRRAYWWNPLVAGLARHALLMLESACDHRCAQVFGTRQYVRRLASMLLTAESARSALAATMQSPNLDVQRLRLLHSELRLRARDRVLIVLLSLAAAVVAVSQTAASPELRPPWSRVAIPATPAGGALTKLLDALDAGDVELIQAYLGAYTPQEVEMPLFYFAGAVRLVEVVSSAPLRIEYVVEDERRGVRRAAVLEVAAYPHVVTSVRPAHSR